MKLDTYIHLFVSLLYVAVMENVNLLLSKTTKIQFESKCSLETYFNISIFWDLKYSHPLYLCNLLSKHFLSEEI